MSSSASMLYGDTSQFGHLEFEKVVQSLLWAADTVILPPSIRPDPTMDGADASRIAGILEDLIDRRLLAMWDFHPSLSSDLYVNRWLSVPQNRTVVLEPAAYALIYAGIQKGTSAYRKLILRGSETRTGPRVEGITEFVSLQNSLWNYGLTAALGAKQLLLNSAGVAALDRPLAKAAAIEHISTPVRQALLDLRGISGIAHLSVDDLIYLRKHLPNVRDFVSNIVEDSLNRSTDPDLTAVTEEAKRAASQKFVKLANEEATKRPGIAVGGANAAMDWTLNLLAFFSPWLLAVSFAKPVVQLAISQRSRRGILFFMAELERRTTKVAATEGRQYLERPKTRR